MNTDNFSYNREYVDNLLTNLKIKTISEKGKKPEDLKKGNSFGKLFKTAIPNNVGLEDERKLEEFKAKQLIEDYS
jgi:hypothetical protein